MTTQTPSLRVLYLEDNPVDADLTRRKLARMAPEMQLEVVTTLRAALEQLASECPPYDVVLADLSLPDGSGLELLAHVRERELQLAVVIITGSGDQDAAVAALKAGADDYLVKRTEHGDSLPLVLSSARSRFLKNRERRVRQLRVLYAEPNAADADLTRRYLARHAPNIRLEVVGSGDELLARLPLKMGGTGQFFDVLLLDYRMPGMNALEIVKILRQERDLELPVILITGHGNEEVAVQALRLGVDEYLVKHEGYLQHLPFVLEKMQKESELIASETRYRRLAQEFNGLLNAIPDSISLRSPDLKVLWTNRSSVADLGKEPADVVGLHCYSIWHNRSEPCVDCPAVESFCTGEAAENTVTWPDGRVFDLRAFPITEAGNVVSVIEVSREITEQRKMEEQLRHAQKMESIGTLAGGIAHDFNNILTAIVGYSEVAYMRMKEDEPNRHNIDQIRLATKRAVHLTKDLLLFSRKQNSVQKNVDLNEIVRNVESFLKRVIREDIVYKTFLKEDAIPIFADSYQLEQVLINLATNARDAMPEGGSFTVVVEKVDLNESMAKNYGNLKPGQYACLTASDKGMGMDEATCSRIFEPFFTTKEVGKGTGLGMAVVYGIIKQHEGFINVTSEPGRGTTFKILLPLKVSESVSDSRIAQNIEHIGGNETILTAEDDDLVRSLTTIVLEDAGYRVIAAVDGEDAVRLYVDNKDIIDLLVFDLIMPNMNGSKALDEIRKIKPEVKAILVCGYLSENASVIQGVPVLNKPISTTEMLRTIRNVLDEAGGVA